MTKQKSINGIGKNSVRNIEIIVKKKHPIAKKKQQVHDFQLYELPFHRITIYRYDFDFVGFEYFRPLHIAE